LINNDWYLELSDENSELPSWLRNIGRATLDLAISSRLEELERLLGRPRANKHLPIEARADEVRGWLRLDEELQYFQRARLVPIADEDLGRVLSALQVALSGRQQ
jgi:hypothetical protein